MVAGSEVSGIRWRSGPRQGSGDAGWAGRGARAFTSDPRAGRTALKVGAPPEGRSSRDAKGARPRPSPRPSHPTDCLGLHSHAKVFHLYFFSLL